MPELNQDLQIFSKFNFEIQPVGIKYLLNKPRGIERLETNMAFCEMLKEAQSRTRPFYIDKDNEDWFWENSFGNDRCTAFC